MTSDDGFRLVTRALALCCIIWSLSNLLLIPTDVIGIMRHLEALRLAHQAGRFVEEETYWTRYYSSLAFGRVVGLAVNLWLARWLYRGATGVRKFFSQNASSATE
jgi:hypothetical protein